MKPFGAIIVRILEIKINERLTFINPFIYRCNMHITKRTIFFISILLIWNVFKYEKHYYTFFDYILHDKWLIQKSRREAKKLLPNTNKITAFKTSNLLHLNTSFIPSSRINQREKLIHGGENLERPKILWMIWILMKLF